MVEIHDLEGDGEEIDLDQMLQMKKLMFPEEGDDEALTDVTAFSFYAGPSSITR